MPSRFSLNFQFQQKKYWFITLFHPLPFEFEFQHGRPHPNF